MKKSIAKTMLLVMIVVVSVMMVAQISKAASIATTKHNLSLTGNAINTAGTTEICVFCHTPHFSAAGSATGAPLWNRNAGTLPTYTMYTSGTMDMVVATNPQGVSAACLSCHDGTVAFDALLNKPGTGTGPAPTYTWTGATADRKMPTDSNGYLSPDLSNDHPISITYKTSSGAGGDTAFVAAVSGKVGALPLFGAGKTQVECASCHSVHDNTNAPFLRVANGGSALCLTCHIK